MSSEGTSEPKVESSAMPKITTESSTQVPEAVRKISKPAEPPVEQVTTTELPAESKTEVPESTVETTEPAQKAVEDVAFPEKTSETKKADETIEPSNGNLTPVDAKPANPAQDALKTEPEKEPEVDVIKEPVPVASPVTEEIAKRIEAATPETILVAEDTSKTQPEIEPLKTPAVEPLLEIEPVIVPANAPEEMIQKTAAAAPETESTPDRVSKTLDSSKKILESRPATKMMVITTDPLIEKKPVKTPKRLFEPIIIEVPRTTNSKMAADESVLSGAARVRIVDGLEPNRPCSIRVSQENVSLLNDGGSVGILVRIEGDGEIKNVLASSSSPNDVNLKLKPGVSDVPESRFYIIKSVSTAIGVYQVNFESQCGRKEVTVKVR